MKRILIAVFVLSILPAGLEACGICKGRTLARQPTGAGQFTSKTVVHYTARGSVVQMKYFDTDGELYATLSATHLYESGGRWKVVGYDINEAEVPKVYPACGRAEIWDKDNLILQMNFPQEYRFRLPRLTIEPNHMGTFMLDMSIDGESE